MVEPLITFDRAEHLYRIDGVVVPSVTQVLTGAGLVDSRYFNNDATNRGSAVALITELHDKGTLAEQSVPPGLRGYLEAWKSFLADSKCEITAIEEIVANGDCSYGGTLDRRANWGGVPYVLDIKTGAKAPWHSVQTAAYAYCFNPPVCGRACVYLRKEGKYSAVVHGALEGDWDVFRAALIVARWRNKHA